MTTGEVVEIIILALLAVAFAAWARRLDRALDVLEEIRKDMSTHALEIERRLTRLESASLWRRWGSQQDEGNGG